MLVDFISNIFEVLIQPPLQHLGNTMESDSKYQFHEKLWSIGNWDQYISHFHSIIPAMICNGNLFVLLLYQKHIYILRACGTYSCPVVQFCTLILQDLLPAWPQHSFGEKTYSDQDAESYMAFIIPLTNKLPLNVYNNCKNKLVWILLRNIIIMIIFIGLPQSKIRLSLFLWKLFFLCCFSPTINLSLG